MPADVSGRCNIEPSVDGFTSIIYLEKEKKIK